MLNSLFRVEVTSPRAFEMRYLPAEDGKSIQILIQHDPRIKKETIEERIDEARNVVFTFAERYGWDSWLEVEVDIEALNNR